MKGDLINFNKSPYYISRGLKDHADIILMPHNNLQDPN